MMSSTKHTNPMNLSDDILEKRINSYRTYLVRNLKVFDLVMKPCLRPIITKTEAIMRLERGDQITAAANMFLEEFLQSKEPDKWDRFKKAIMEPQHALIVDIIQRGETPELKEHDRLQKKLELFKQEIMNKIDPFDCSQYLHQEGLLSTDEVQKILACQKQDSDSRANYLILLYVPRNKCWFRKLLTTMWILGHRKLVQGMDPNIYGELEKNNSLVHSSVFQKQITNSRDKEAPALAGPQCVGFAIDCHNNNGSLGNQVNVFTGPVTVMQKIDEPIACRTRSQTAKLQYNSISEVTEAKLLMAAPLKTSELPVRNSSAVNPRQSSSQTLGFTSPGVLAAIERARRNDHASCSMRLPVGNKIKCKACLKNFASSDELLRHQKLGCMGNPLTTVHSDSVIEIKGKSQKCNIRKEGDNYSIQSDRPSTQQLQKRIQTENDVEYQCDFCFRPFRTKKGLNIHKTKMHGPGSRMDSSASQERPEKSRQTYDMHKEEIVQKTKSGQQRGKATAPCGSGIKNKGGICIVSRHDLESESSGSDLSTSSTSDEDNFSYKCSVCGEWFDSEKGMKIHKTKKHGK